MLTQPILQIARVAVIDDDAQQAEATSLWVEEADLEPQIIVRVGRPYENPEEVIEQLRNIDAQGAICDHRLTHHQFSTFNGAELTAALYDVGLPSILTTQYVDMDVDVSIRKWRRKIPVLLSRDETDSDTIRSGLLQCYAELLGQLPDARQPYRALIRVTNITNESDDQVVDVIIPQWNPQHAVRFPLSIVPPDLAASITVGTRLFALVNVGANDSRDLYFDAFELAPEIDPANGLA